MKRELELELEAAIKSNLPLEDIVSLLRRYKDEGITQQDAYKFLEKLHQDAPTEAVDDRILEVSDFAAGFCAPHMQIWNTPAENPSR